MIAEETQQIFVERTLLVKQEIIARRNYKVGNWLKLLSLHEQNSSQEIYDEVIKAEIHENFIMQEGFWLGEVEKRFKKEVPSKEDVEIVMLGLQDGQYYSVARLIAQRVVKLYKEKKMRENFCLGVLEKIVGVFGLDPRVSFFYKCIREIYKQNGAIIKIRSNFERELKLAHDNYDLVWDEYKMWEPEPSVLNLKQPLQLKAKELWEQRVVEFDEKDCSESNIRQSLVNLEGVNQSKIDEERYMLWLEKLQTETEKLWFLRRMALNYRQLFVPYLLILETLYRDDEQTLIKKYSVVIRLSGGNQELQRKYLHFLGRRIAKHLLNQTLPEEYNQNWSKNVVFFREEISHLIQKVRVGTSEEEMLHITQSYYELWIEIETNIIKDKDSVCQLFENLLKGGREVELYEEYAKSLVVFGALKDAKNVLKRYTRHKMGDHSRGVYQRFIELYGTVDDQVQFLKEGAVKTHQQQEIKGPGDEVSQQADSRAQIRKENGHTEAAVKSEVDKTKEEQGKFKREATKDGVDQKIYESMKKRLHVDANSTIYLKGIPTTWKESDILSSLKHPEKVVRVGLVVKNNEQRDYCYIEYQAKEEAEEEIRNNTSGFKLYISKPPSEYDQSSTLFICALPQTATEDKIKDLFGEHRSSVLDVRLKLSRDKNIAYVEFQSVAAKDVAFEAVKKERMVIDGKKIIVQHCDSSRTKTKKFIPVVFIKNLAFKARESDLRKMFEGKSITKLSIPINADNRAQGFAYVEFEKFKDYQDALDMKKGTILGREVLILRSDREISDNPRPAHRKEEERGGSHDKKKGKFDRKGGKERQPREKERQPREKERESREKEPEVKDNNYFSTLFK